MGQRKYTFDAEMQLKDAGLVGSTAAATVGGGAKVIDLGTARFEGVAIIDVTAIEIASNDELYDIVLEVSSSATFASDIEQAAHLQLGATEVRDGGAIDSPVGRYELMFCNEQADTVRRYLRARTVVSGTVATGINYSAWVAPLPGK